MAFGSWMLPGGLPGWVNQPAREGGSLTSAKVQNHFDWTKIGVALDLVWLWVGLTDFFFTLLAGVMVRDLWLFMIV